jgi:CheY-like chemotaxis protein
MSDRILFVDDEPAVLDGYRRLLGREVCVETAVGARNGLAAVAESGPYGLVISDMRMPEMDGAHFLAKVAEIAPVTVRMALTGYADFETAMYAVNEGRIFRFMTKPASKENLLKAIEAGLKQYHLVLAEKEVLEGTLRGCVSVLSEMLSFSNPAAFGRATRLRRFVDHVAQKMNFKSVWKFEIAAILSQLGCVTLNPEIVAAAFAGEHLSPEDQKKYETHAAVAGKMLSQIPRMEAIAQMIACQKGPPAEIQSTNPEERQEIELGIQLLRTGLAYDDLLNRGFSAEEARRRVRTLPGVAPAILAALADLDLELPMQIRECSIRELAPGMILREDLYTRTGLLIAAKGQDLSYAWIERLKGYLHRDAIAARVKVQLPQIRAM